MPKKLTKFVAKIEELPSKSIFINVNHLEKGDYELNIVHKNKLLLKTNFKKQ
jgi:hypothetical protein